MLTSLVLTALALAFGTYSAEAAGTIHFRDGRQVQADDWWEDGGTFYYVTRGMGQQADAVGNIARVQGEPNWARPFQTDARILFRDGGFADAKYLIVAPQEVLVVEGEATTIWLRRDVMRVVRIPATERGCGATTITKRELAQTEEMVDWTSSLKGGQFTRLNNRLRSCLELRRQAMQGAKPDAATMARACCAE
jgi:hypothetical protein